MLFLILNITTSAGSHSLPAECEAEARPCRISSAESERER